MPTAQRAVIASLFLVVAAFAGLLVVDSLGSSTAADATAERLTREATLLGAAGSFTTVNDGRGTNETVYETTGFAVNLSGTNDSFVESTAPVDVAQDDNWTVSIWGYVDSDAATDNMTALSIDGRLVISYNGTQGNWSAWYYDEGTRDSYRANVSTRGNEAGNFTNIIVVSNGTYMTIYRNNTAGETQNITTSNLAAAPVNKTTWDGRLEEIRTFDDELDSTNRSELVNSPAEQQPDLNRTTRIMFDQPDKSTQLLLFTSADISQSNVSFSQGFDEQIMGNTPLDNDYDWDEEGPRIRPVAGNDLDGAPVVYISYDFATALDDITDAWANFVELVALVPIILMILVIVGRVRGLT